MLQNPTFTVQTKLKCIVMLYELATEIPSDMISNKLTTQTYNAMLATIAKLGGWNALGVFAVEITNDPRNFDRTKYREFEAEMKFQRMSFEEQAKLFMDAFDTLEATVQVVPQRGSDIRDFGAQLTSLRKVLDAVEEYKASPQRDKPRFEALRLSSE